jgi:hypothetical protein
MAATTDEAQRELPDAVVEDILLRLDAGADVVRASAACRGYRRITCDRAFLRRIRLRPPHPPPVVGAFDSEPLGDDDAASHFHLVESPHPSAAAALAVARAADLTFSFLPGPVGSWRVRDVRDGRVLLSRPGNAGSSSDDLVVCDPVHRSYVQIPPIPDGLADAPRRYGALEMEHFLAPAGGDDDADDGGCSSPPPLRVISNAQCAWKIEALVFSSATGDWQHIATCNFNGNYARIKDPDTFERHYANGCFYWTHFNRITIIVFDTRSMMFSDVIRPYELQRRGCLQRRSLAVVDAGNGVPGLVAIVGRKLDLYRQQDERYKNWQYERTILLTYGYRWRIMGASKGVLLLRAQCLEPQETAYSYYFTMDLQTCHLEWVCTTDQTVMIHHLYARHPPPFSAPSIADGENPILLATLFSSLLYIWVLIWCASFRCQPILFPCIPT